MQQQLEIFNAPKVRHSDGDTSRDAAAQVNVGVENDVLHVFHVMYRGCPAEHAGLTDDDICGYLDDAHSPTVKTARSRLSKRGVLVDSGERRPSNRRRAQIVWRLA